MGETRIDLEGGVLDDLGRHATGGIYGDNLVVVAVKNENWDVDLLEVFSEVGLREGFDGVVLTFVRTSHALKPEVIANAFGDLSARPIIAVEGQGKLFVELAAIGDYSGANAVKDRDGQASWVFVGLEHEWRHGPDEDSFGNTLSAVAAKVTSYFSAPGGVANHNGVL